MLEPHFITPFVQGLPGSWQRRLVRNFTLWGWITRPTQKQADAQVDGIRLLTYREMAEFFPDCEIRKERFLGMTKFYIVVSKAPPLPQLSSACSSPNPGPEGRKPRQNPPSLLAVRASSLWLGHSAGWP